jgi:hypothetical protein
MTIQIHEFDPDGHPMTVNTDMTGREHFQITNDDQAQWAMRKLLSYKKKIDENKSIAEAEHYRIDEWVTRVNGSFTNDVAYFEAILTHYARSQRESEDRKTIDTPYGVVKSRATQQKFRVDDAEQFFTWAHQNAPQLISIKESPNLLALKEYATAEETKTLGPVAVTTDGEIIPGVSVEPADVNYTVEVLK